MTRNIVFVVMDTARAIDTSYVVDSPGRSESAIGRLVQEGTTFTNAFATAPWTLPSHASMFTGTFPSKHGAHAEHKYFASSPTLAEVLRYAGYDTAAVTNNVWIADEFGFERGFDDLYKVWQYIQSETDFGGVAVTETGFEQFVAAGRVLFRGNALVNFLNGLYGKLLYRRNDYGAKRTNDLVREWLASREETNANPFFLFVNYLEPHLKYQPPAVVARQYLPEGISYEEAMNVSQNQWKYIGGKVQLTEQDLEVLRGLYRAEIAYLDYRIGKLREALEAAGEWEDTVIVVAGDHGENIGDHGLMDHQYSLHDTLLHVPLVVAGGEFSGGTSVDGLVQLHDLFPTLLDVAGVDAPEARECSQGRSLVPSADTPTRNHVIAEYVGPQPSIESLERQVGELSSAVYEYDRGLRTIRTETEKLIVGSDGSSWLYDLKADPEERREVSDNRPETAQTLRRYLSEWMDSFEQATFHESVDMDEGTKRRLEDLGYLQ